MSIKLSIIIPCYNAEPYIHELLECLDKQMTDEAEVILIDDGSDVPLKLKKDYPWISHFSRQENSGISKTRNKGLELAKGELINFVDADDLVAENYVEYVIGKLAVPDWDYMDLSWKSLEDNRHLFKLNSDSDSLPNPSASTRVFKRSFIGDVRFPEMKDAAEDEDFTRHLQINKAKHICATEYMYFYRIGTPGSNYKRFTSGLTKTQRIGYYFDHITADMTDLIEEIKETEKIHEVIVLTKQNDIPELELYANVKMPEPTRVMESRGEPCSYFYIIPVPVQADIVLWTAHTYAVGGIETFVYNFCKQMSKKYSIVVLFETMTQSRFDRLKAIDNVKVIKNDRNRQIYCDTVIINRIFDTIPTNVVYKKSVQMVHCVKQKDWHIPRDRDFIVNVSQVSKASFGDEAKDGIVIHNPTSCDLGATSLLLVSATRVGAEDKQGNDDRCRKFAKLLDDAKIPFVWIYFSDKQMLNAPKGMVYGGYVPDTKPFIAKADYLIQLSGQEAFSYSILESLEMGTPVIVTPLPQNKEMKIKDGENGYIVPFDVDSFDVNKILKIPKFTYKHNNDAIVKKWQKILDDDSFATKYCFVRCIVTYKDLQLNRLVNKTEVLRMTNDRAKELVERGFVEIVR